MNPASPDGNQLSFLSDARGVRPDPVTNARMALNVLQRLLEDNPAVTSQSAVLFKAILPAAVAAAEFADRLPVTKTTLRQHLINPAAAIMLRPPTRPDELAQMESLLEFVNRRLSTPEDRARHEQQVGFLLGARNPELLITPDGMPSQLYGTDREDATLLFRPLLGEKGAKTAEALVEAYVLLRANNADVQAGIATFFWHHNTGSADAAHYIEGCSDGQARGYFKALLKLPPKQQEEIFSLINLQTFYAALGN